MRKCCAKIRVRFKLLLPVWLFYIESDPDFSHGGVAEVINRAILILSPHPSPRYLRPALPCRLHPCSSLPEGEGDNGYK